MFKRAGLLIVVVLLLVCTGARAQQQDPFFGTWEQNLAKSKYEPAGRAFQELTLKFEGSAENAWAVTQTGVNGQGKPNHAAYTATLDGSDGPIRGSGDWDTVAVKKLNANTMIMVNKKEGITVRMILATVSEDGKTFTEDIVGYDVHLVAFHNVVVFDKQ